MSIPALNSLWFLHWLLIWSQILRTLDTLETSTDPSMSRLKHMHLQDFTLSQACHVWNICTCRISHCPKHVTSETSALTGFHTDPSLSRLEHVHLSHTVPSMSLLELLHFNIASALSHTVPNMSWLDHMHLSNSFPRLSQLEQMNLPVSHTVPSRYGLSRCTYPTLSQACHSWR